MNDEEFARYLEAEIERLDRFHKSACWLGWALVVMVIVAVGAMIIRTLVS